MGSVKEPGTTSRRSSSRSSIGPSVFIPWVFMKTSEVWEYSKTKNQKTKTIRVLIPVCRKSGFSSSETLLTTQRSLVDATVSVRPLSRPSSLITFSASGM